MSPFSDNVVDLSEHIDKHIEPATHAVADQTDYVVLFSQNSIYRPVELSRVQLAPRPFDIHLIAFPKTGVGINVQTDPSDLQDVQLLGAPPEPMGSPGTAIAERPFNESRQLFVDSVAMNYLVYQSDSHHRFDEVDRIDDVIAGRRTVAKFHDNETDEIIPLQEAAGMEFHFIELGPADDPTNPRIADRAYTLEIAD